MKNSIWYRFQSEKDSYEITFDTTYISIKDIRQNIIRRRNMIKYPEKFDLIFYDEENPNKEIEDKEPIKPMKHLIVKRLPHYYYKDYNFIKEIKEPKDFMMNKIIDNTLKRSELQQIKRFREPLEKIAKFLRKEILYKQFKCKNCEKFEEDIYNNYIITLCCKETICLNCYNKEEEICPLCKNEKKGYVKNESEINLVKKLLGILTKKEEQEKLKEQALSINNTNNNNLNVGNDINQNNADNNQNNNINAKNNQVNLVQKSLTTYQLQKQLLEGSQFFIIKSSNTENIQKSKNNSVWATTIANSNRLNQAFNKGKVILIFSVNGTQIYKGYAIMTSFSAESPSNLWQLETNIKLGGDFSVSWLCYCELPFSKTKNLQVNKSRDCTFLDSKIGYDLCELCYEQEKEELERNQQRIKIEINEQFIKKINDDIINNKNKQKQKANNNINNKPQQIEQNKISSSNNNEQNQNTAPNPQPIYFQFPQVYMPYFAFQNQFAQLQQKNQDINNQNKIITNTTKIENQPQVQQKQENEKKEKKEDNKHKYHKSKRRSRSRDRSRSRSRNKNKSRSSRSRRSNSSSSRSEGRSKYSKSHK